MKNVSVIYLFLVTIFVSLISSCCEVERTDVRLLIYNDTSTDYKVVYHSLPNMDTTLTPKANRINGESNYLLSIDYVTGGEPKTKYTVEEFEDMVESLSIYTESDTGEKIYYGGSKEFVRQMDNWKSLTGQDCFFRDSYLQYTLGLKED